MTILSIKEALKLHLEVMPNRISTVWQNQGDDSKYPRLEVSDGPIANTTETLDGLTNSRGLLQVTVVVESGGYSTKANEYVQQIIDLFPVGQKIDRATIYEMPSPSSPITGDTEYRIPITIKYKSLS